MRDEPARHTQGTIRRRGSRWQVDTTVNGRRVRRAAPSFEAARQILEELGNRKKGRNGSSVAAPASGVTVAEILQRYLRSTKLHCRPRTIRTSEAAVRRLIEFFGDTPASGLSRSDFDRFSADRMAGGVGPHTPNRDLACLRAAFTQAKDDGLMDRVPKIRMLRTVQPMPRILALGEIRRLLDRGGDLQPLIATAVSTGMRAAELRWLTHDCLNLHTKAIDVRAKLDWRPKTHAERTIPIPDRLVELLSEHRETVDCGPTDWVFPVPSHGGQWSETGLSHAARRVAEQAGVWRPGSKPLHDLRHSWASHLMAAGVPMDTVRRLGGWASNATLEKFYLAPTEQALVRAVEASDSLI